MDLQLSFNILNSRPKAWPKCSNKTHRSFLGFSEKSELSKAQLKWKIRAKKFSMKKACSKLGERFDKLVRLSKNVQHDANKLSPSPNDNVSLSIATQTSVETRIVYPKEKSRTQTLRRSSLNNSTLISLLLLTVSAVAMIMYWFKGWYNYFWIVESCKRSTMNH